jgi:N,N'-diacetyllegionaminate synthase
MFKDKVFVIAEIGVNHNGSLKLAKKLIIAAKKSGADAVKFQHFSAKNLTTITSKKASYQIKNTGSNETQFEMLKKLELKEKDYLELNLFSKKNKIMFLSSVFDERSIDFIYKKLKIDLIKVPSGEITNLLLLRRIDLNKHKVILSTGMSTIKEISEALNTICKTKVFLYKKNYVKIVNYKKYSLLKKNLSLLHCVTDYPVLEKDANLLCVKTLSKHFKLVTGYSDHTLGVISPLIAVSFGSMIIEKHFTLSKKMKGPDHKASLEPHEFAEMMKLIRNFEVLKGNGIKIPQKGEKKNIPIARKSIVAKINIKKGEKFSLKNLTVKRPGNGISPMKIDKILNKKSKYNYKPDQLIRF